MDLVKHGIFLLPKATVSKGFSITLGGVSMLPILKGKEFGYEVFRIQ
jgi:hypothetical protein